MGLCLSKAQYGQDSVGLDYGPVTFEAPFNMYCGCYSGAFPSCIPINNDSHSTPRVLSLAGLSKDERKLWKCIASGNVQKAQLLIDSDPKQGGIQIPDISAIRLEGEANMLIGIATVDYSAFSVEAAKFLLSHQYVDIDHVNEKTKENALMAALQSFKDLQAFEPFPACSRCLCSSFCCIQDFKAIERKQHCMELINHIVDSGIDTDYMGTGMTALQISIELFAIETQGLSVCDDGVSQSSTFSARAACMQLAHTLASKMMRSFNCQEKVDHVLHQLIQAAAVSGLTKGSRNKLGFTEDVKSVLHLASTILETKHDYIDIQCQAQQGQGDNLLCALMRAMYGALDFHGENVPQFLDPILSLMEQTCKLGINLDFLSNQDDHNALHLCLGLIDAASGSSDNSKVTKELPEVSRRFVEFASYSLVEAGIDLNHVPKGRGENAFFFALNLAARTSDKATALGLINLCLLLIDKGINLGDGGQVDPKVLFLIFNKLTEQSDTELVDSFFKLARTVVINCKTDLNYLGSIDALDSPVTPLLLLMRMHDALCGSEEDSAPKGYLELAYILLDLPVVDTNIAAGDKVTAFQYALIKYIQTGWDEWHQLMLKLHDRRGTKVDTRFGAIQAPDVSAAHLVYPKGMPIPSSSTIIEDMFGNTSQQHGQVSCLGIIVKALVLGQKERAHLQQRVKSISDARAQKEQQHQQQQQVVNNLKTQAESAHTKLTDSHAAHESAVAAEADARQKLQKLEAQLQSNAGDSNQVHPDPDSIRRQIEQVKKDVRSKGETEKECNEAYMAAKIAHDDMKQKLTSAEAEYISINQELERIAAEMQEMQNWYEVFDARLYHQVAARLQMALDLLLKSADTNQDIDLEGNDALRYIVLSMARSGPGWHAGPKEFGESLVLTVEKIMSQNIMQPVNGPRAGKALLCLAKQFGHVQVHPNQEWWERLFKAILGCKELDIDYKDPSEGYTTPLLGLLKSASSSDLRSSQSIESELRNVIEILLCANAKVDVFDGAYGHGTLHYLLRCHTGAEILHLPNLLGLLQMFMEYGMPGTAKMFKGRKVEEIQPAHLHYMFALCCFHGGIQGVPEKKLETIMRIMETFFDSNPDKPISSPDDLGKASRGQALGYLFHVWELYLSNRRSVSLANMKDLFSLLMKYGLDVGEVIPAHQSWHVLPAHCQNNSAPDRLLQTALMLVVNAVISARIPVKEDYQMAVDLFALLIGEENEADYSDECVFADVNEIIKVNQAEGYNTILHVILQGIIHIYSTGRLESSSLVRAYEIMEEFIDGDGCIGGELQLESANHTTLLQLRALLDILKLIEAGTRWDGFARGDAVHEESNRFELLKWLMKQGLVLDDETVELPDFVHVKRAGLDPVESVLYGALSPIFKEKGALSSADNQRRVDVAVFLLKYLLDDSAQGPADLLRLKDRRDDSASIVHQFISDDPICQRLPSPFFPQIYSRYVPFDPLVWTMCCLLMCDTALTERSEDLDDGPPSEDTSPVLRIAHLLLEHGSQHKGGQVVNSSIFIEQEMRKEGTGTRSKRSAGNVIPPLGRCPLILLVFDVLQFVQAPPATVEVIINLLLEYNADPTVADQDYYTLLMRIAKVALSRDVIEPFMDNSKSRVLEEMEDAADAEIEHFTDLLVQLKDNAFVRQTPNFINMVTQDGKTAFLLGMEVLVKNKHPAGCQAQIINQLLHMEACPIIKDKKGSDAGNLYLMKGKDRDIKDEMRRAVDKYDRLYEQAFSKDDIPFLEKLVTHGAVDVSARMKDGDGLAIWAAIAGRADMLRKLLDADRSNKLFDNPDNFIKNDNSILHLAVLSGGDNTHLDVVDLLLTHERCKAVKFFNNIPLEEVSCDNLTAFELLNKLLQDRDGKSRQKMLDLFNADPDAILKGIEDGNRCELAAKVLKSAIKFPDPRKASGRSKRVADSCASWHGRDIVAEILNCRYSDQSSSALMMAIKHGSLPLVEAVLQAQEMLESPVGPELRDTQQAYLCGPIIAVRLSEQILKQREPLTEEKEGPWQEDNAFAHELEMSNHTPTGNENGDIESLSIIPDKPEDTDLSQSPMQLHDDENDTHDPPHVSEGEEEAQCQISSDIKTNGQAMVELSPVSAGPVCEGVEEAAIAASRGASDGFYVTTSQSSRSLENTRLRKCREVLIDLQFDSPDELQDWLVNSRGKTLLPTASDTDPLDPTIVEVWSRQSDDKGSKSGDKLVCRFSDERHIFTDDDDSWKIMWKSEQTSTTANSNQSSSTVYSFYAKRLLISSILNDEDAQGKSALEYAVQYNKKDSYDDGKIVELLLSKKAKPGSKSDRKRFQLLAENSSPFVKNQLLASQLIGDNLQLARSNTMDSITGFKGHINIPEVHKMYKWHVFISHSQEPSEGSVANLRRVMKEMTRDKIKIWTDKENTPSIPGMEEGARCSEKLILYLVRAEDRKIGPRKVEWKKGKEQREDVLKWLERIEMCQTEMVDGKKVKIYDHPGTLWRAFCLFELAHHFDVIPETTKRCVQQDQDEEPPPKRELIFVAESNTRLGGTGMGIRGHSNGAFMKPYLDQLHELEKVMSNDRNKLRGQDKAGLTNDQIIQVLKKLEKCMDLNDEVMEWSDDEFQRYGLARRLLDVKLFPSVVSEVSPDLSDDKNVGGSGPDVVKQQSEAVVSDVAPDSSDDKYVGGSGPDVVKQQSEQVNQGSPLPSDDISGTCDDNNTGGC